MLQVLLGQFLHQLDELFPVNGLPLDDLLAAALLIFFGVKTLLVCSTLDIHAAAVPPLSTTLHRDTLDHANQPSQSEPHSLSSLS